MDAKGLKIALFIALIGVVGFFLIRAEITGRAIAESGDINVDFGAVSGSGYALKSGAAAAGSQGDFWNRVISGFEGLKYSDGKTGDVGIKVEGMPYLGKFESGDAMYDDYIYNNLSFGKLIVSKVNSGKYNLYLYGHGKGMSDNVKFGVIAGSRNYGNKSTSEGMSALTGNWIEGVQYVKFNIDLQVGENITIFTYPGNSGVAVVNGLQMSMVSENESGVAVVNNGECIDTDKGFISNQSGSAILGNGAGRIQKDDFCDGNVLMEYGCSEDGTGILNASIACFGECFSGACLEDKSILGLKSGGQGCIVDGKFAPFGYRVGNKFCDLDGSMKLQKRVRYYEQTILCSNNFECESNLCSERRCIPIVEFINDTRKFRAFTIKGVCRLTNPVNEESYLDCIDEYLTNPLINDLEKNKQFCYMRVSIEERTNESNGRTYFMLNNTQMLYGDYGNLVNEYHGGISAYVAKSFDYVERELNRTALYSSRFMFTDDYSGEELTGGVVEFREGIATLVVPNNPQVRRIKLFDVEGEELSNLRISKEQSNCIRKCGVENETINLEQGEDCCPGFKAILKSGAFADEWSCEK